MDIEPIGDATSTFVGDFVYDVRYFHMVDAADMASIADGTSYLYIDLTSAQQITYPNVLVVNSRDGQLTYQDHYYIDNNGWRLVIRTNDTVTLEEGWVLELFVYKLVGT